jgi:hypothetical protein
LSLAGSFVGSAQMESTQKRIREISKFFIVDLSENYDKSYTVKMKIYSEMTKDFLEK